MRKSKAHWIAVLTVALTTNVEARAHGFVFSGGFAPPPPPPGLGLPGTPSTGGPSGFPGSTGAGGGSGATPPVSGGPATPPPSGGGSTGTGGTGGSATPPVPGLGGGPAGGGAPRSSGSGPFGGGSGPTGGGAGSGSPGSGGNGRPTGRPAAPAAPGAGRGPITGPVGGARGASGTAAARPRPAEPWLEEMKIDWTSEFLPYDKTDQYAAVAASAQDALRRPVDAGGWRRADRPTIVVFVDAAEPSHAKALRALDADGRLRIATKLFNCFRVDAGTKSSLGGEVAFAAFRSDGTPVGEVAGCGKPSRIYDLMAKAYSEDGRGELGVVCNAADPLVKHSAHCRWLLRKAAAAVVCPDCGELREDVAENVRQLKDRRADAERRIEELAEVRRR